MTYEGVSNTDLEQKGIYLMSIGIYLFCKTLIFCSNLFYAL